MTALLPAVAALLVATPAHPVAAGPVVAARPLVMRPALPAAAPLAVHAAETAPSDRTHLVAPGETLSGIAIEYGTTVSVLSAANGLADPDWVRSGTTLTVPAGPSTALPARLAGSPTRMAYGPTFDEWAAANGVPPDLLKAMTWLESGWQNHLVSSTGAVGIGQLMPDTVDFMEELIGVDLDPTVPEDNIRMAARYLRWLLARFGTPGEALAAYYQGPSSIERHGLYDETEAYVANVLALRPRF